MCIRRHKNLYCINWIFVNLMKEIRLQEINNSQCTDGYTGIRRLYEQGKMKLQRRKLFDMRWLVLYILVIVNDGRQR
jgi:hypothetical protein